MKPRQKLNVDMRGGPRKRAEHPVAEESFARWRTRKLSLLSSPSARSREDRKGDRL